MAQATRRRFLVRGGGAVVALGAWRPGRVEAAPAFDLLLKGGTVLDGTGAPAFVADVAVKGDAIAEVGEVAASQAARVVDVRGLHVCPGFVDMHSHSDGGILVVSRGRRAASARASPRRSPATAALRRRPWPGWPSRRRGGTPAATTSLSTGRTWPPTSRAWSARASP